MRRSTPVGARGVVDTAARPETVRDLLLWARRNKIAVSEIQIGDTRLVVTDLGMGEALGGKKPTTEAQAAKNLYAEMGGAPFAEAMAQEEAATTYDEDDDDE